MTDITNTKKIKLMFIVGSLGTGGAERFVANALNLLPRDRFNLSAAFYRPDRSYTIPDDVQSIVLGKFKPWDNIKAGFKFSQWIDKVKPDIIISAWSVPNVFTAETLRWTKHKPIWIARIANDPTKQETGAYGWWARNSYKKADHFISVASDLADTFASKYPFSKGNITTIHNAVNIETLIARASEKVEFPKIMIEAINTKRPIIISIGRLEQQKRFDLLLHAFKSVHKKHNALLVILGEGGLRSSLETLAKELKIHQSILMPGFVHNPYAWLVKSNIFTLASDHEGMSNALLEAQALGLPSVATDCPFGTAEVIINNKTGVLIETGNSTQLAEGLKKLVSNEKLCKKMGQAAKINIATKFSSSNHINSLSHLFETIYR